jgi:ABC-type transporter Mla MlaB component
VLTLEVQNHPHVTVLRCSGRIVHGDGADTLLRAVMSQVKRHLQIDLSGVETIDAGGLGVLAAFRRFGYRRACVAVVGVEFLRAVLQVLVRLGPEAACSAAVDDARPRRFEVDALDEGYPSRIAGSTSRKAPRR